MSAPNLSSLKSPLHSRRLSPPLPTGPPPPRVAAPRCCISIVRSIMANCTSRDSVLPQFECVENGGTMGTVAPKFAEIVIVRHGETEWNMVHRIQGHLDVDLNDVGRQQAVAVADHLSKEPKISAVYSSDLRRAYETAEVIAKHCGVDVVIKEPDFRERHLGDLQGVVYSEIAKVNPKAYKAFVSNQEDQEIPGGGESFNKLYKRCTSALQRIAMKHQGERVVVVSHGGTIRALHRRALQHRRGAGNILNTSVSVFHISNEDKWSIKLWCDVSHLNQSGFLSSGFGGNKHSG